MEKTVHEKVAIILTSVESKTDALTIAEKLVKTKLAACVQISAQGESIYHWQESLQQSSEYYLTIKTTPENSVAVIAWLEQHHPYDLPEILYIDAEASSAYTEWLGANTCNSNRTR